MTRWGFLLALFACLAFGQSGKKGDVPERSVEGTVVDQAGNPVAKAVVQLKDLKTASIRSFITQEKGTFFFGGLNPDTEYEVRAELDGVPTQTKPLSKYNARPRFIVVLKLTK